MKKILLYCLITLSSISCIKKESNIAVIKGEITGLAKGVASICSAEESHVILDSVIVQDGKFTLKINVECPTHYFVFVKSNDEENSAFISNIFLGGGEKAIMTAQFGVDRFPTISNAPLQEESNEYKKYIDSQEEGKESLRLSGEINSAFKEGDKIKVNELNIRKRELNLSLIKKILNFKDNSILSPVAAYYVFTYAAPLPLEDKITVANMFPSNTTNLCYLNILKESIAGEKSVALGNKAADFNVTDLDGNEYTLDSFNGKYIFIEFSASWCGWCKKEIPHVREAYHKFKDKNIVFITMNMDITRELWTHSVKGDNIEWLCLSNLEGMDSNLAKSYNIHGIPMSYVIDPQKKIIQQDIRGNEIIEYLSSIL